MSEFNTILHDALERQKQELKPCPFCGGNAELKTWWAGLGVRRFINRVQCTKCRCNSGDWKIKPKAIKAWNRRAGESE